ncbi:MAG: hypothetical protein WBD86_02180 [Microgenomates group bacterium]
MIEKLRGGIERKFGIKRAVLPETQYYVKLQDGNRFWVCEEDYFNVWEPASMLAMKKQFVTEDGTPKILSIVASQEYRESWKMDGTLDPVDAEGIEIVWVERDKVLETPFPQLPQ